LLTITRDAVKDCAPEQVEPIDFQLQRLAPG
jgi:hypothetical protein